MTRSPPWSSITFREIDKPSPIPSPILRVVTYTFIGVAILAILFPWKSKRLASELLVAGYSNVRRYQLGIPMWRAAGGVCEVEIDGIRHIVALRGDPPQGATKYEAHPQGFAYAVDLVKGLKSVADFESIVVSASDSGTPQARSKSGYSCR